MGILIGTLIAFLVIVLGGCATSSYKFETHESADKWTKVTAKMPPKDLEGLVFEFKKNGGMKLQTGKMVTADDPLAELVSEIVEASMPAILCAANPLLCVQPK